MSAVMKKTRSRARPAFEHLDPAARRVLIENGNDARLKYLYTTELFIEHPRSRQVLRYLEFLYHMPRRTRMPGVVISADSGMGKTQILRCLERSHPSLQRREPSPRIIPALYCQVPPSPSLLMFQQAFLHSLGAPPVEFTRLSARNGIIADCLRDAKTRIIMIDELQHVLAIPDRDRRQLLDWMKYLSTETRLPLVFCGVRGCELPIVKEPQLATRIRHMEMQRWKVGPELAEFVHTYERICPLRRPSYLSTQGMMKALVRESEGVTDLMMRCLTYAASIAIVEGEERITPDILPLWTDPTFVPPVQFEGEAHARR